jgi:ABC-2 type transport system permease protein
MRINALILRIIRQFKHDKRSLALMFVAPIFILTLMSLVFNGSDYHPKLAVVDASAPLEAMLTDQGATITMYTSIGAEQALIEGEVDAIIAFNGVSPKVTLEGSDPSVNRSVMLLMQEAMQQLSPAAEIKPDIEYLHGSADMSAFDNFGPVLVAFFSFFFVFLLSGIAFLRERTGGTLERLLATPLKRGEIVTGYLIGFGLFAMLQSILIAWYAIEVLDMLMVGSFWLVLVVTLTLAFSALTLGTFLSAFASNEFQMIQFIPLIVVPQVFFSGLFTMETMVDWLRWLSYIMPLSYAADAMRDVMIRGEGWAAIANDIYVLLAFSLFFAVANVFALRKHRKI